MNQKCFLPTGCRKASASEINQVFFPFKPLAERNVFIAPLILIRISFNMTQVLIFFSKDFLYPHSIIVEVSCFFNFLHLLSFYSDFRSYQVKSLFLSHQPFFFICMRKNSDPIVKAKRKLERLQFSTSSSFVKI